MLSKFSLVKSISMGSVLALGTQASPGAAMADLVSPDSESVVQKYLPMSNQTVREADATAVDGHLFVCVNDNFVTPCNNFDFNNGQCINFFAPFQDSISSLGPDSGFACIVFKLVIVRLSPFRFIDSFTRNSNCSGESLDISNPGISSLSCGTDFNDQISSFQCFPN